MTLSPSEERALVEALDNGGNLVTGNRGAEPGPGILWEYGGDGSWDLTEAGKLLAQALRDRNRHRDHNASLRVRVEELCTLSKCPRCGGRASNGFDLGQPPKARVCASCCENHGEVVTCWENPMRLAMAKAKLTEWEKLADEARQPHQVSVCAAIQWEPDHGWTAEMEWPEEDVRLGAHTVSTCGPESDDPLTAVVEASKQTPWPLEE